MTDVLIELTPKSKDLMISGGAVLTSTNVPRNRAALGLLMHDLHWANQIPDLMLKELQEDGFIELFDILCLN
jgi:hypothetical protein